MKHTIETIQSVIEKHLTAAVDDIQLPLDLNQKFTHYGATSLDIVEIVSSSMMELKIKVPRPELSTVDNIQGLVDIFLKYSEKDA